MQEMPETPAQSLSWEDPLEEGMATHSSILAWTIPWTEELGELQFPVSQKIGHDGASNTHMEELGGLQSKGSQTIGHN